RSRLVAGTSDNLARVYEVATGRVQQFFTHAGPVRGVAFHPAQPAVITASADKTAAVHALTVTRVTPASAAPLRAVAITPNGSHVLTGGDDKTVKAWNLANGMEERSFAGAGGPVYAIAVTKNAEVVA